MSDHAQQFEPDQWIPHPASDHGDLDIEEPLYGDSLTGEAKAEFDAAVKDQRPPAKLPVGRRTRRRKQK